MLSIKVIDWKLECNSKIVISAKATGNHHDDFPQQCKYGTCLWAENLVVVRSVTIFDRGFTVTLDKSRLSVQLWLFHNKWPHSVWRVGVACSLPAAVVTRGASSSSHIPNSHARLNSVRSTHYSLRRSAWKTQRSAPHLLEGQNVVTSSVIIFCT